MNHPILILASSLALLVLATWVGDTLRRRAPPPKQDVRTDAGLLLSGTLTLLYFVIGFTFSMAINRYDLRKNCEYTEAIAIGTEYSRADLLAPADAPAVKILLKKYVDGRVSYYKSRSASGAANIEAGTVRLQEDLWSATRLAIANVPPPLMGLLLSGMNDVINSQRSTQAAWLNRIPLAAWTLIVAIAAGCCWVIGYRARTTDWFAFMIVPLSASVCFFLIADLDSPRGGVIRVTPNNLVSVSQMLQTK